MASQPSSAWDLAVEDFFDYAISNPNTDSYTGNSTVHHNSHHGRPGPNKQDSSDTMISQSSGITSLSASDAASPGLDSPDVEQISWIGGQMQMVWSAEAHDFIATRPAISDQHHEKSCPRCSLTEAEARKCRLDRRREQNRESQRKFRARKEAKIREAASQVATLETYVEFLERHNSDLEELNTKLQKRIAEFGSSRHACPDHAGKLREEASHVKSSRVWDSRTHSDAVSTVAQEPISAQIPDLHLSLFDHELLPPYGSRMNRH